MLPNEAYGKASPTPKKLNADSDKMNPPRSMVAITMITGVTFGIKCLNIYIK